MLTFIDVSSLFVNKQGSHFSKLKSFTVDNMYE